MPKLSPLGTFGPKTEIVIRQAFELWSVLSATQARKRADREKLVSLAHCGTMMALAPRPVGVLFASWLTWRARFHWPS